MKELFPLQVAATPQHWAGLLIAAAMLAGPGLAEAQVVDYYANGCKISKPSEGGPSNITPWTAQDSPATIGNVIAFRTLGLSAHYRYGSRVPAPHKAWLLYGARWNSTAGTGTVFPTDVDGISVRITVIENSLVIATRPDGESTLLLSDVIQGPPPEVGQAGFNRDVTLKVELIVTGKVATGEHKITGFAKSHQGTTLEGWVSQIQPSPPPVGAVINISQYPGTYIYNKCNAKKDLDWRDVFYVNNEPPPPVKVTCTVDSQFGGDGHRVSMGTFRAGDFPKDGSMTPPAPFRVSVNQCVKGAKPRISFNARYGVIQGSGFQALKLEPLQKAAQNLGIVIVRQGDPDKPLSIGEGMSVGNAYMFDDIPPDGVAEGSAAGIDLAARYMRIDQVAAGVTPGPADSQLNFRIVYD